MLELPVGYVRRSPEAFDDMPSGVVWQGAVYDWAWNLAHEVEAATVVDLGCGNGQKLERFKKDFYMTGVDRAAVIGRHDETWARWISFDLDSGDDVVEAIGVGFVRDALVVCADVIEHLSTPTHLLSHLQALLAAGALAVVVSTPDRAVVRGPDDLGPPENLAHAQEWTSAELERLLDGHDLHPTSVEHVRSNDVDPLEGTTVATIGGHQ